MKRISLLLLAALLLLLFTGAATASAEAGIMPLDSDYFTFYGTTISSPSSGKLSITFSCGATCVASQLGVSTYTVQRWNGSAWEDDSGLLNGSTGKGVSSYSFSKSYTGSPKEEYRVTCSFSCVIDNSMETKTYTSGSVTTK